MSRGGGNTTQTGTTTSYTTTLPEYFEPYATAMASRAQTESLQGYTPYGGQRLAGFTPEEQVAMNRTAPYTQNVVDVQKREAARDAEMQLQHLQSRAAQQQAYGGYRHGQQESNLSRQLAQQLGDIQARGQAAGYEDAYSRFIADREGRLAGAKLGLEGLGVDQQGRQLRQQALGQLSALAPQADRSQQERLAALQGVGMARRGMTQEQMDMAYQDFLRQSDYPKSQIEWYSEILRGLTPQPNQQVETFSQRPGAFQTLAGLGLGGLGLYKSLQGMG